jgi:hypothetical protein
MMSTLVQTRTQPDEQGRVYAVQMSLFYAAQPIAMLIIGGADTIADRGRQQARVNR